MGDRCYLSRPGTPAVPSIRFLADLRRSKRRVRPSTRSRRQLTSLMMPLASFCSDPRAFFGQRCLLLNAQPNDTGLLGARAQALSVLGIGSGREVQLESPNTRGTLAALAFYSLNKPPEGERRPLSGRRDGGARPVPGRRGVGRGKGGAQMAAALAVLPAYFGMWAGHAHAFWAALGLWWRAGADGHGERRKRGGKWAKGAGQRNRVGEMALL